MKQGLKLAQTGCRKKAHPRFRENYIKSSVPQYELEMKKNSAELPSDRSARKKKLEVRLMQGKSELEHNQNRKCLEVA